MNLINSRPTLFLKANEMTFSRPRKALISGMAGFTEKELEYLRSQRLARMATADSSGQPHVLPVGFRVFADAAAIEVGGRAFGKTKKYRDIRANPKVAIVIDDLASITPWTPRGIEVREKAVLQTEGGVLCHQVSLGRGSRLSES